MNKEIFYKEIEKLDLVINDVQKAQLNKYYDILVEYNKHTNLTRIIEEIDVYNKHFYDSLTIVKVIDINTIENLIDIGSGAGFPGVVLKIFFPNINVTLLDSNQKKTKFLKFLVENLDLDIEVVHERAEIYGKIKLNSFDLVTARAVANLRVLFEVCNPLVKKDGYFLAMKGQSEEEINEAKETIDILDCNIIKVEKFNLPIEESIRSLILVQKKYNSKIETLREYDKILKNPLKKIKK